MKRKDDDKPVYDTLSEYHLHNPNTMSYEILQELLGYLQQASQEGCDTDEIAYKIQELLTDAKSEKLFKLICEKGHVDIHKFHAPKLLLHLICLTHCYKSVSFVADKLGLDSREAGELLEHLKHSFTIDDPIDWLNRLHLQSKDEHNYHIEYKNKQTQGHDITSKPPDTSEDRKQKLRRRFKSFFKFWY